MCEPMTLALISAAMTGGGMYMQQQAQDEAQQNQMDAINREQEAQDQLSRKSEQASLDNAKDYTAETRMGRFMDARQKAGDSLVAGLTQAREQQGLSGGKSDQATGRLSQDFLTGKAAAAADEYQKSVDMARAMGNMRGTGDMLNAEGLHNADSALDASMLGAQARRHANAAQPGIQAAGQPDGTMMMLGGLASGIGGAGMSYSAQKAGRLSSGGK